MNKIGLGFLFVLLFSFAKAQTNQDFGMWAGFSVSHKISKKIKVNGVTQFRTFENSQALKQLFADLSVSYKYNKYFKIGVSWRGKESFVEVNPIFINRFGLDLKLGKKIIKKTHLGLRSRTQYSLLPDGSNKTYERTRLKLTYKLSKGLSVFVQDELFFNLNPGNKSTYNKNRFGIGGTKKINKKVELTLKYLRITEVDTYRPLDMNVLFMAMSYKI